MATGLQHYNTFGSSSNAKLKTDVGAILGFVETGLRVSGESWHRVSFTAASGLTVLTVSCIGVLICDAEVR